MSTALLWISAIFVTLGWCFLGGSGLAQGEGLMATSDTLCTVGTVALGAGWLLAYMAGASR